MFQGGSEAPPTYSAERGEPQQAVACYTSPLVTRRARSQDTGSCKPEGKQLHPRPLVRSQRFLPSTAGKVRPGAEPARQAASLLITTRRLPDTKLESPAETSRTPPFTTTQFHVLLTLSSKFFSIFHHCTCLLSVSG